MARSRSELRFWAFGLAALGCAGEPDVDSPESRACTPGVQVSCACPGSLLTGAQTCAEDGRSFGACLGCDSASEEPSWPDAGAVADATSGTAGAGSGGTDTAGGGGGNQGGASASGGAGAVAGAPSGPPQSKPPAPPPDGSAIVKAVAAEHPDWLASSCVANGGNNELLLEIVRRLRKQDDRWGLNWKRGVVGDLSQDVVDYHYGNDPSEGSTAVYIIDVIGGHCGLTPSPGWLDVTQATLAKNEIGRWTLAGKSL